MRALFSGSFDPVTNGHLDIIERVASVAECLLVAIARNAEKQPLLPEAERVALLRESCKAWDNVRIDAFQGLIVDAARDFGATVIVRGIRSPAELDRELQMAQVNRMLSGIETWLVPATAQWAFVSSSLVKELVRFGGDITSFVPAHVAARLRTHGMAG